MTNAATALATNPSSVSHVIVTGRTVTADLRYQQMKGLLRDSRTTCARRRISRMRRRRSRTSVVWLSASTSGPISAAIRSPMRGVGSTNANTGSVSRPSSASAPSGRSGVCPGRSSQRPKSLVPAARVVPSRSSQAGIDGSEQQECKHHSDSPGHRTEGQGAQP
jgi:hypothetical protein